MTEHAPDLIARAFEIADEAMFELLDMACVPVDEFRTSYGLVDENFNEVSTLVEASAAIQEAVAWLQPRDYISMACDESGEYINVWRRPGEE